MFSYGSVLAGPGWGQEEGATRWLGHLTCPFFDAFVSRPLADGWENPVYILLLLGRYPFRGDLGFISHTI